MQAGPLSCHLLAILGRDGFVALTQAVGGTRVYVAYHMRDDNEVVQALETRLKASGVMHTPEAYAAKAGGWVVGAPWTSRSATELDAAIRALGKAWRAHVEKAAKVAG